MCEKIRHYPYISVVIPCYKAERYIKRAIDSVREQKHVNVQIIVVEDGVVDNTGSVVSTYGETVDHVELKENQGASVARNTGLEKTNSDYVLFLDADDYMEGDLLAGLYKALRNSNTSLAFGPLKKIWERTNKEYYFYPPKFENPESVVERWLKGNSGPNPASVLWRVDEIKRIGCWNNNFKRNQDGELIIRAMLNGCTVASSYQGAGVYTQHSNERISKKYDPVTFDTQEQLEKYVQKWLKDNYNLKIKEALNDFRLKNAVDAYRNGLIGIGAYWERKWRNNSGKIEISHRIGVKRLFINTIYLFLGLKKGAYCVDWIRKIKSHVTN